MKYKGTLIVVKDCNRALKFYSDMFGFQLLQDNDGNMELTNNIYLQELRYSCFRHPIIMNWPEDSLRYHR